jgi:MSHA biogenesis protein MshJ
MKASTPIKLNWAPLRAAWQRQAKRVDALSLRERAILFLSLAAVLAALLDSLVLSPLGARAKLRSEAARVQAGEVDALRQGFVVASQGGSDAAGERLRAELIEAQRERSRLDSALGQRQSGDLGSAGPPALAAVLQRLLAQAPGLQLSRLTLLDAAPPRAGDIALPGMRWHGVDLQIQGEYAQQLRYLRELEQQLPGLQWGELRLSAPSDGGPQTPRMQAQVFVLQVQP